MLVPEPLSIVRDLARSVPLIGWARAADTNPGVEGVVRLAFQTIARVLPTSLMSPVRRSLTSVRTAPHLIRFSIAASIVVVIGACGSDGTVDPTGVDKLASISIDSPSFQLERGNHQVFTATATDTKGRKVTGVPFVWRVSDENVASVDLNGRVTALGEGTANLTASALGITSGPVGIRVVWQGAAKLTNGDWVSPAAATPSTPLTDSIRVVVLNKAGGPAPGATIQFAVTAGGGTLSATKVTADAAGRAATQWTLGPNVGLNTATATAVDDQGAAVSWVNSSPVTFSVTTSHPLSIVSGSQQSGTILADLPVAPSVKLVDGAGKPRPGIPVTFVATGGGQVAFPIVSTGADGVASPGVWTLGDIPGDQVLNATVESATIAIHATATGTPIRFTAAQVSAGGNATCAISSDGTTSCWGRSALLGIGDTLNRTTPTKISTAVAFKSLVVGLSHTCGIATTDQSLYCWGFDSFTDTAGKATSVLEPMRLGSSIAWTSVATGLEHTCAVSGDQIAYCWGVNTGGQLGVAIADTITRYVPVAVYGGFKFTAVASGIAHTCALTTERTTFCWGSNQNGQLGDGTQLSRVAPTVVGGGLTFQTIGAGEQWTCGLTTAGKPYCWGAIQGGTIQTSPQAVPNSPTFASMSVGGGHACGLTSDGTAYCWGANGGGQLGDSTTTTRTSPVKVVGGFKFASISAGDSHTCGRSLADNAVLCWGINRFGELGDAKAAFRLSPRYIILGVNP